MFRLNMRKRRSNRKKSAFALIHFFAGLLLVITPTMAEKNTCRTLIYLCQSFLLITSDAAGKPMLSNRHPSGVRCG